MSIRWYSLNLALLSVLPACGPAPDAPVGEGMSTLAAADSAFQAAVVNKDLEGLLAFYLDDAVLMPAAVPMMVGIDAIREEWAHTLAIPDLVNEGVRLRVEVARGEDLGITMGTYLATMRAEEGGTVAEPGKWLTVWKRQADGGWRIAFDTYNTDIPPPDHK
jgi:ketosteroid isomerase-like protein